MPHLPIHHRAHELVVNAGRHVSFDPATLQMPVSPAASEEASTAASSADDCTPLDGLQLTVKNTFIDVESGELVDADHQEARNRRARTCTARLSHIAESRPRVRFSEEGSQEGEANTWANDIDNEWSDSKPTVFDSAFWAPTPQHFPARTIDLCEDMAIDATHAEADLGDGELACFDSTPFWAPTPRNDMMPRMVPQYSPAQRVLEGMHPCSAAVGIDKHQPPNPSMSTQDGRQIVLQIPLGTVRGLLAVPDRVTDNVQVEVVGTSFDPETGHTVHDLRVRLGCPSRELTHSSPPIVGTGNVPCKVSVTSAGAGMGGQESVKSATVPNHRDVVSVRQAIDKTLMVPKPSGEKSTMVCCHWKNKGWCKYQESCKFAHPEHKRGAGIVAGMITGANGKKRQGPAMHSLVNESIHAVPSQPAGVAVTMQAAAAYAATAASAWPCTMAPAWPPTVPIFWPSADIRY